MSYEPTYRSGDWLIICDVCGKKMKASESKKRWDGFIVCPEDWEIRHPMDFLRARQDKISVPFQRPEPSDVFITVPWVIGFCTPSGSRAIPGFAIPGCLIPSKVS